MRTSPSFPESPRFLKALELRQQLEPGARVSGVRAGPLPLGVSSLVVFCVTSFDDL